MPYTNTLNIRLVGRIIMHKRIDVLGSSASVLLICLIFSIMRVSASEPYTVGVKVGDWIGSTDISFEWASNWSGYEEPPSELSYFNMSMMRMDILEVCDTNVTVQSTISYRNGTIEEYEAWVDIVTGEGDLGIAIIPANLDKGDEIPANLTWYTEEPLKLFINGTVIRRYAGANREVNHVNITCPVIYGNVTYGAWNMSFYWDRKTGLVLEEDVSYRMSYTENTTQYYMNMSYCWRTTATEMWPSVFTAQDGYTLNVTITSNTAISDFDFNESQKQISFNATGPADWAGYCNVTISNDLLKGNPWIIYVNSTDYTSLCDITGNGTHTFIYIPYTCSTNTIQIKGTWAIPEFPSTIIILLFMIATILTAISTEEKISFTSPLERHNGSQN